MGLIQLLSNCILPETAAQQKKIITGGGTVYLKKMDKTIRALKAAGNMSQMATFADNNVLAIVLSNWDSNTDGVMLYSNLAGITSLANKFTGNTTITSFEELQYFGLTIINSNEFNACVNLIGSLNIPSSVLTIGGYAFYDCSGFTGTLTFPAGLTSIGNSAFRYCSGLTGTLTFPAGLTSIGNSAFGYCSGFTGALTFPAGLTSIEISAFQYCSGFTGTLTFPAGLTSIGDYAFGYCSGFTGALTLPAGLTSIGNYAFQSCNNFSQVTMNTSTPPTLGLLVFTGTYPIRIPAGSLAAYSGATNWSAYIARFVEY
jgi:hypothetical protein